jgi:glyoxylase-like metal-dependent hydrolase (beta-lactamase superfamily II)/ferredoxin
MAHVQERRNENASGDFYVDRTCIDCDTCRWMAPQVFHQAGSQSAVYHQPINDLERLQALQALLACPTASIGTVERPTDIKTAQASFPIPVTETIFHCGYHAENSYGAASYVIQRPDGNVLVDSPRFAPPLIKRLEAMGGIRYLYLTHRDDVADHRQLQDHFGCDRILHQDDLTRDTQDIEIQISGSEPIELAPDLLIIPVPGHTKGHTVLLYNQAVLFSGDHLAWSERLNHLIGFRNACWFSWPEQIQSMKKLAEYSFDWVLPGHGRRYHAEMTVMHQKMQQCLAWMEAT